MKRTEKNVAHRNSILKDLKKELFVLPFFILLFSNMVYATGNDLGKELVNEIFSFARTGFFITGAITGLFSLKYFAEANSNEDPGAAKLAKGNLTAAIIFFSAGTIATVFGDKIVTFLGF